MSKGPKKKTPESAESRDPNLNRRLYAGNPAPTKKQHKKPCADCPWARASLSGWLNGESPDEWLARAHGEVKIPCHLVTAQCAGAAIYRANVCKRPRSPDILQLPKDKVAVFDGPAEFKAHHDRE
jgi:hypothetical protein